MAGCCSALLYCTLLCLLLVHISPLQGRSILHGRILRAEAAASSNPSAKDATTATASMRGWSTAAAAATPINAIAETYDFAGTPLLRRLLTEAGSTEAFHRKEAPTPAPAVWPAPDLAPKASLVPTLMTHPTGSAMLANAPTKTIQVSNYLPPEPGSICQKKARCYIMILALLVILSLMFLGPLCWAYLADKRCRLQYERDAILSSQYPMDINAKPLLDPQGF